MTSTAVEDDLRSVETKVSRRVQGREELLASLNANGRVRGRKNTIPDRDNFLAGNIADAFFEVVILKLPRLAPRGKMAHLPVQSILGKALLWADEVDLLVGTEYLTVIPNISMSDGCPER